MSLTKFVMVNVALGTVLLLKDLVNVQVPALFMMHATVDELPELQVPLTMVPDPTAVWLAL
jgi:hypothetical protein